RHAVGNLAGDIVDPELVDLPRAAPAGKNVGPGRVYTASQRTDDPHSGDDDTAQVHRCSAAMSDDQRRQPTAFCRNATASPKVWICSAASSGISTENSSSKAITSSTWSSESAPRSSMKLAFSVTFSASTLRCSTTILRTRSAISLILNSLLESAVGWLLIGALTLIQACRGPCCTGFAN